VRVFERLKVGDKVYVQHPQSVRTHDRRDKVWQLQGQSELHEKYQIAFGAAQRAKRKFPALQ